MQPNAICKVALGFRDREGRKAIITLNYPSSLPFATLFPEVLRLQSALQGASDALIVTASVTYTFKEEAPAVAGSLSNTYRKLALFYRNEQGYEMIMIPSPKLTIFELIGVMAGVRLNSLVPEVAPLTMGSNLLLDGLVTAEGDPFPTEFVVGGMVK